MDDVVHVGQAMWEGSQRELQELGISPLSWVEDWRSRINRGDAVSIGGHAILGCDWETQDVCNTSFQADESFPRLGKQITKALRKAIPDLMRERGARLSFTYSLCIDPEAVKWFRLLGLEEDVGYQGSLYGGFRMRRFMRGV